MKKGYFFSIWILVFFGGCKRPSENTGLQQKKSKENLAFRNVQNGIPQLDYLLQDFKQGSIYLLGNNGQAIEKLDSMTGFIRGFDMQDSLLAWCSDSTTITLKNLEHGIKRNIDFDSTIRIHHDLVLHYPYLSALYSRKNYAKFKSYQVIEEGFVRVDLRTLQFDFWSIHNFLEDSILPLRNVKGNYVTAHGNSIDVDQDGNYYISFRDFNQVWKVSSDLTNVLYRIGLDANIYKIQGEDFIGQHSIDIVNPDIFYLFDNGSTGNKLPKSRIVYVTVKPAQGVYQVKNILALPDSLSTIRMGSVHSLGDALVVSTFNNGLHILELDIEGKVNNHLVSDLSQAIKVLPVKSQ